MKLLSKFLFNYRLKGHKNPYKTLKKFSPKNDYSSVSGRVLIVPYRVNSVSNLFEGNVAALLKNKGFIVDALLCGGAVKYCDNLDSTNKSYLRCQLCIYEQNEFSDTFKVNSLYVDNLIDSEELNEIKLFSNNLDFSQSSFFNFRGVNFKRSLMSALQLYYKTAEIDVKKYRNSYIGFTETICKNIVALDKYFSKHTVDFVLLSHGVYSTWGTVQEYCQAKNIKFVTWGREYNGAGIIAAHNDSYLSEPMYESDSVWDAQALSFTQRQLAISYLESKTGIRNDIKDYVNYHKGTKRILPAEVTKKTLGLNEEIVIGLFPNIPWDGQAFRPQKIFKDINEWIFETIKFFRTKKNTKLIIRSHPAELGNESCGETMAQVIMRHFGSNLPANVIILPPDSPISSLSVASISNGCILYGSTVGYETMFIRKPTILASDFFYSNKDITFDPKSESEYFQYIEEAIEGRLVVDEGRFERLLQYTYHYQYRRIMPEKTIKLDGLYFSDVVSNNIDDFFNEPTLNKFIECCLTGKKFYFDEFYN